MANAANGAHFNVPNILNKSEMVTKSNEAVVEVVEQPNSIRFRHQNENRLNAPKKPYTKIRVHGYRGHLVILVSCVTANEPYRVHPHHLVGRDCEEGICHVKCEYKEEDIPFYIRIQSRLKNNFSSELAKRRNQGIDPFLSGFEHTAGHVDLHAVRLCFQVFLADERFLVQRALPPVCSDVIKSHNRQPSI